MRCFRRSSSFRNPRISPLTIKYESPRLSLLINYSVSRKARRENELPPPTYFKVLKKPTRQEQSLCFLSHANNIQKAISQIAAWSESTSKMRNRLTACLKHSNFLKVKDLVLGDFLRVTLRHRSDAFTNTRKLYQSFPQQQNETEVYSAAEKRWIKDLKPSALPFEERTNMMRMMNREPPATQQPVAQPPNEQAYLHPPPHHIIFKPWIPTTSFLTATALIYTIGAGITAAAGTRLALQLLLDKWFKLFSLQSRNLVWGPSCYFLSLPPWIRIG